MTQEYNNLKKIRDAHRNRLYVLEEHAAIKGISADPAISIEIADIKEKIKNVSIEITQLDGSFRSEPKTYSCCVNLWNYIQGQRDDMKSCNPRKSAVLDFTEYFDQRSDLPRFPGPQEWDALILPKLQQLATNAIDEREIVGFIHVTPALGVAFGAVFAGSPKTIWVNQGRDGNIDWWHSNAKPGVIDVPIPNVSDRDHGLDTIIDVCAVPGQRQSATKQVTRAVEELKISYGERISIGYLTTVQKTCSFR